MGLGLLIQQVGNVDPPTVIPSKVIAINNPIEVLRGRRVLLQGAASPGFGTCASRPSDWLDAERQAHPKLGASWEGFALEHVLRVLRAEPGEAFYWGTHGGAELDLK